MSYPSDSDDASVNDSCYDEAAQDALEQLSPAERMIVDVQRGISIIVAFSVREVDTLVDDLTTFVVNYPQFAYLIQPHLDHDPENASMAHLEFEYPGTDPVIVTLKLFPLYVNQLQQIRLLEITMDDLKTFLRLIEPFSCFMTDGGDIPLNFG
jgi:hypothetical protein